MCHMGREGFRGDNLSNESHRKPRVVPQSFEHWPQKTPSHWLRRLRWAWLLGLTSYPEAPLPIPRARAFGHGTADQWWCCNAFSAAAIVATSAGPAILPKLGHGVGFVLRVSSEGGPHKATRGPDSASDPLGTPRSGAATSNSAGFIDDRPNPGLPPQTSGPLCGPRCSILCRQSPELTPRV